MKKKMVLHNITAIIARLSVILILLGIAIISFLSFVLSMFDNTIRYTTKGSLIIIVSLMIFIISLCILNEFIEWLIKIDKEKLSKNK